MIQIFQYFAIIATIMTGMFSIIAPKKIEGFTGIKPIGNRGVTEIRSIFGGIFVGLGISALFIDPTISYLMMGITYLSIAGVRAIFFLVDKSFESSNIISLVVEILFGILFIID